MRSLNLKKLILGLIILLVGCDVTLLFAAQATQGDGNTNSSQAPKLTAAAVAPLPLSAAQTQQLQQLQTVQQTALAVPSQSPAQQLNQPAAQPALAAAAPDLSEAAFNSMARNALPMTSDQVQRLKQLFGASQLAASAPAGVPPRPTASSQMVNLAPGATPPVIRLAQGFVTSLVFVDSTGAAWPIESFDVGNPTAFNIQWNRNDNTLMIQASSLYTYGNLAVRLRGLGTPVMLTLIPGQKAVDYRVDLRIQGLGPNAVAGPMGDNLPTGANPELLNILDGVPPAGSKVLKVQGGNCQAWIFNNKLYVRTRLTILSPAWIATMSSADGTKAYEMPKTPQLLVSQDGKTAQLKLEGL